MAPTQSTPLLGTDWVQAQLELPTLAQENSWPAAPTISTPPTPSLCFDLSEFRRHLQQYRKLDDSINLALNRNLIPSSSSSEPNSQSDSPSLQCAQFWKLLTTSWLNRENLIRSCIETVDESVQKKNESFKSLNHQGTSNTIEQSQLQKNKVAAEVYTTELKRRMIHDELAVESAIRKQTMQKFRIRCPSSLFTIPSDSPPVELIPHPSSN